MSEGDESRSNFTPDRAAMSRLMAVEDGPTILSRRGWGAIAF